MTETDWLRCDDINQMHRFFTRRKLDLFLCAVYHQIKPCGCWLVDTCKDGTAGSGT
jgi:hypothetical protein